MDEEKKEAEKIDIFNPALVFALVAAFIGDFTFFLVITHYLCGIIVLASFFPKSKGFLAKGVLLLAFLLPLPTLMIGIFLAIILSNKVLAFIAEQAAVIAATVLLTPAGGAAAEGAALAGGAGAAAGEAAVGAGVAATEAAGAAAGTAAEVGGAVAEGVGTTAEVVGGAAEGAGTAAGTAGEAAGEAGETAKDVGEGAKSGFEKAKEIYDKAKDMSDRISQGKPENEKEEKGNADEELISGITGEQRALLGEKGRLNEEFFEQPMKIPVPPETDENKTLKQNVVSGEKFRETQKIQDIKRQQQKPKPIQEIPIEEDKAA